MANASTFALLFPSSDDPSADVFWLFRLLPTLTAYGTLLLLGHFLVRCIRKEAKRNANVFRRHFLLRLLRQFAVGQSAELRTGQSAKERGKLSEKEQLRDGAEDEEGGRICSVGGTAQLRRRKSLLADCLSVSVCFAGIQVTLICMGFFQERIVTRGYPHRMEPKRTDFFRDTQFLVFSNRIVALALSGAYLFVTRKAQPPHVAPLYLHSFSSFSNVIASWCQYEALKYVSFPAQTVCKASKIVPTMLMGILLRGQRYSTSQYAFALTLVLGTSVFFLATSSDSSHFTSASGTSHFEKPFEKEEKGLFIALAHTLRAYSNAVSGFLLMLGYLLFDAFTPNWQKKLLEQPPRISCSQMMFCVNAFSVLICLVPLLQQWTLPSSVHFLFVHESVLVDCLFLSLGSSLGQVFIYLTIQNFGPVVLSVIMTLRQIFSIILSSLYFVHPINLQGFCGLFLVFGAIFFDACNKHSKSCGGRRTRTESATN
ncbi:hypothetical protein niasHT_027953 [Heterodera trifolii]|uniref:Adenosine 3'-phospho 5'-phosphosulfate transporter 1 n=1 Tax=Heterodera trifolii TaxID=157864 RepID=A0ABD2KE26_9BILA